MSRVIVLLIVVVSVIGGLGYAHVESQEKATLEARIAALEANAIPRSPNLTWNGGGATPDGLFDDFAHSIFLVCVHGPTGIEMQALELDGMRCEVAPPAP